jgi:hypothetical protein
MAATQPTPAEQFGEYAKDAFYVTVGLGVLAVQQLQVQRRQFTKWLNGQANEARTSLDGMQGRFDERVKAAEERLAALEEQANVVLTELKDRLPDSVKEFAEQSIEFATQARADLYDLFGVTPGRFPARPTKPNRPTKAA